MISNSLIVGVDHESYRVEIANYLDEIKKSVSEVADREFIYFIVTRPRVRIFKRPKFSFITKRLILPIEIGRTRRKIKIKKHIYFGSNGHPTTCPLSHTGTTVSFWDGETSRGIPIHDLLLRESINVAGPSNVRYVGRTNNPARRVIDGNHRGLSDTLTLAAENNDDVFIFSNIFKAVYSASIHDAGLHFRASNALTDYVDQKFEAELIEKIFILYFSPITQYQQKEKDTSSLKKMMATLRNKNNVHLISVSFEIDSESEYYHMFSENIAPRAGHYFTCWLDEAENINMTTKL